MPVVNFLQRVAGALSGAAAALLKFRPVLFFDPTDFDVDDDNASTVNGTSTDPGIATGYTRVRLRGMLTKSGLVVAVTDGTPVNGLVFYQSGNPNPFIIFDLDQSAAFWDGFPRQVYPTTAVPSAGITGKLQMVFDGTDWVGVFPGGTKKKVVWAAYP